MVSSVPFGLIGPAILAGFCRATKNIYLDHGHSSGSGTESTPHSIVAVPAVKGSGKPQPPLGAGGGLRCSDERCHPGGSKQLLPFTMGMPSRRDPIGKDPT
jgi:hypothetical protein